MVREGASGGGVFAHVQVACMRYPAETCHVLCTGRLLAAWDGRNKH